MKKIVLLCCILTSTLHASSAEAACRRSSLFPPLGSVRKTPRSPLAGPLVLPAGLPVLNAAGSNIGLDELLLQIKAGGRRLPAASPCLPPGVVKIDPAAKRAELDFETTVFQELHAAIMIHGLNVPIADGFEDYRVASTQGSWREGIKAWINDRIELYGEGMPLDKGLHAELHEAVMHKCSEWYWELSDSRNAELFAKDEKFYQKIAALQMLGIIGPCPATRLL